MVVFVDLEQVMVRTSLDFFIKKSLSNGKCKSSELNVFQFRRERTEIDKITDDSFAYTIFLQI